MTASLQRRSAIGSKVKTINLPLARLYASRTSESTVSNHLDSTPSTPPSPITPSPFDRSNGPPSSNNLTAINFYFDTFSYKITHLMPLFRRIYNTAIKNTTIPTSTASTTTSTGIKTSNKAETPPPLSLSD